MEVWQGWYTAEMIDDHCNALSRFFCCDDLLSTRIMSEIHPSHWHKERIIRNHPAILDKCLSHRLMKKVAWWHSNPTLLSLRLVPGAYGYNRYNMRGNGIVSRIWRVPEIHATARSMPIPNPLCGTLP